jgi:hypothetical protein
MSSRESSPEREDDEIPMIDDYNDEAAEKEIDKILFDTQEPDEEDEGEDIMDTLYEYVDIANNYFFGSVLLLQIYYNNDNQYILFKFFLVT